MSMYTISSGGKFASNEPLTRGGVNAILATHIHDEERDLPIFTTLLGPKNIVKAIIASCQKAQNRGKDGTGAVVFEDDTFVTRIKLPLKQPYRGLTSRLATGMYQGALIHSDATVVAGMSECYVLVPSAIQPTGTKTENQAEWLNYLDYVKSPRDPKFATYRAPKWCIGLYRIYLYIRGDRLPVPVYPQWMPYLFKYLSKPVYSPLKGTDWESFKLIRGMSSDLIADAALEANAIQHAYRLNFQAIDTFRSAIASNPDKADGISFN